MTKFSFAQSRNGGRTLFDDKISKQTELFSVVLHRRRFCNEIIEDYDHREVKATKIKMSINCVLEEIYLFIETIETSIKIDDSDIDFKAIAGRFVLSNTRKHTIRITMVPLLHQLQAGKTIESDTRRKGKRAEIT